MAETATQPTLDDDDREIEEMRRQVLEMEQDLARENDAVSIAALARSNALESPETPSKTSGPGSNGQPAGPNDASSNTEHPAPPDVSTGDDPDSRSIYVGNVDYGATPEEIQAHFASCGTINRVTILLDKFTGHPKGYAYVEFAQPTAVEAALVLHESLFRGRLINVTAKRKNLPAFMRGIPRGRGRGGYRGGGRGHPHSYSPYGRPPRGRGRGRGY